MMKIKTNMMKRNAMTRKNIVFAAVTAVMAVLLILIIPMDFFAHGFYCDVIEYDQIEKEDRLGNVDLAKGPYETAFSPVREHFAGFEVNLTDLSQEDRGILTLTTYTPGGKEIETVQADMSSMKEAFWYMVYTHGNYHKDTAYKLVIQAEGTSSPPKLSLVHNDYLSREGMGNNLLMGYAYSESTFTQVEKILIFMVLLSVWLILLGELCLCDSKKKRIARTVALFLCLTTLLSWNFMFNSFDVENAETFSDFQLDSDSLVAGPIVAEKSGAPLNKYNLGRYRSTAGNHVPYKTGFRNDSSWEYGYSKTEPQILITRNSYTKKLAVPGTIIEFENGQSFTITQAEESGGSYILTLDSKKPLNSNKYGELDKASFYSVSNGTWVKYPVGYLEAYDSQYGLQGKVFRHLARYMDGEQYLDVLNLLCCVAAACVLTAIILLTGIKYNFLFAFCFGAVFLLSPWIVNFAGSLYWVEVTWFLPMLAGLVCSLWIRKRWVRRACYIGAYLSIAGKSLCGYEYITAVMLGLIAFLLVDWMMAVIRKDRQSALLLFRTIFIIGVLALAGFATAICIHAVLRGDGSILEGVKSIINKDVLRRVGGGELNNYDAKFWPSINASVWETVKKYFHFETDVIAGVDANLFPSLCLLPILIFVYDYVKKQLNVEEAVLYMVFFFIGMSWFVLAKSHSYAHTHLNFVMWYFGYVQICFYVILSKILNLMKGRGKKI